MSRRRFLIVVAAICVLILVVPYAVYALDYAGNYNVKMTFTANKDLSGAFSVSATDLSSEPTEAWDFWDILKGHSTGLSDAEPAYFVQLEISRGGALIGYAVTSFRLGTDESTEVTVYARNVAPGEASVRLYIEYTATDTVVYDRTVTERIP